MLYISSSYLSQIKNNRVQPSDGLIKRIGEMFSGFSDPSAPAFTFSSPASLSMPTSYAVSTSISSTENLDDSKSNSPDTVHMEVSSIADRLLFLRKHYSLTQQQMADKVGCSKSFIQAIEEGKRKPPSLTIRKMADKLDVSFEWLNGSCASELFSASTSALAAVSTAVPDSSTPTVSTSAASSASRPGEVMATGMTTEIEKLGEERKPGEAEKPETVGLEKPRASEKLEFITRFLSTHEKDLDRIYSEIVGMI